MTPYVIHTVDNPTNPRDSWGVFVHVRRQDGLAYEQRVVGPANLLDCIRERDALISAERHGELVR